MEIGIEENDSRKEHMEKKKRGRKPDITMVNFKGEKLQETLANQGIQQKELSAMIGCTPSALSKWINNDRISIADLMSISNVLGVDYRYLTGDISNKHEIYEDKKGDLVLDHPSHPSEWFDLMFTDTKEFNKRFEEIAEQAKQQKRKIMTESQILERKRREREVALKHLNDLLHTGYMYPSWQHAESAEMLSNLLEELRMYIESLPDVETIGKEGK